MPDEYDLLVRLSQFAFLGHDLTEEELFRTRSVDGSAIGQLCKLARQASHHPAYQTTIETTNAYDQKEVETLRGPASRAADATAAVFLSRHLKEGSGPSVPLQNETFGQSCGIDSDLPIYRQPKGALATGVLVAPQIVATAAHVVTERDVSDLRFVFGFRMAPDGCPPRVVPRSEVYCSEQVVGIGFDPCKGIDWALIKVNRLVEGHTAVHIRRTRWPNREAPLYLIGHPWGLPSKCTGGGKILMDDALVYFHAELGVYNHDSGAPAFNATDDVLEGLYDGGPVGTARVWIDRRTRAVVFHLRNSPRPRFTRTCVFEHLIDPR